MKLMTHSLNYGVSDGGIWIGEVLYSRQKILMFANKYIAKLFEANIFGKKRGEIQNIIKNAE